MSYPRSDVSEGTSGSWVIEHFDVPTVPTGTIDTRPDWAQSRAGRHTRLRDGNTVMMTDTIDEWWTQRVAIDEARRRRGHALVTGLGLGVVAEAMLASPGGVAHLTVVEASDDVINLVADHLLARYPDRLDIVHADAFTWEPPADAHYGVVWHDIWPNPYDPSVWPDAALLEARFGPWCDWQGSWVEECRAANQQ